ncbi:MAG: hypothetical protein HYX45_04880 [Burkholderiales bacterium]|nr:hypothetical protein [Burkholderiales bacterium]
MKDHEKVLDICRRIERVLQRDWGGSGHGLREKLTSTQYVVPADLEKRIRYLHGLQKKATGNSGFKLKSSEDFLAKGEQVIKELALARHAAKRRLLPWLRELALKHRVIVGTAVVALVAGLALLFFLVQPEPAPVTVPRPVPKPAPKPAPRPKPAPAPATAASAPAPAAVASAPAPAASAPVAPASAAVAEPAPGPAGVKVHIETPPEVVVTLRHAEVVQGASGRDEIAVIVDVQNMGYPSLKRITFDAWLYDTSGAKPLPVILASGADATPWHAFLRLAIMRGQSAEVRLNYSSSSKWSSDQAIALVNSGRYQIRLKAVSLIDDSNKSLGK